MLIKFLLFLVEIFQIFSSNPQKTNSLPDVTLSSLETQILELNQYYSGNLLNYTFVDPHNDYFSYYFESSFNNKTLMSSPFHEQVGVDGFIIVEIDIHKLFCVSLLKSNILEASLVIISSNLNFSITDRKNIESNLDCSKLERFSNLEILVQCLDKKNNSIVFLQVIMSLDNSQDIFVFNTTNKMPLTFPDGVNTSAEFNACQKDFKIFGMYLFLYCKATQSVAGSDSLYLFIYDENFSEIYYYDTINQTKINQNLSIQDITFIDTFKVMFVLDYYQGVFLLRYNASTKTAMVYTYDNLIDNTFYTIYFIKTGLGCYQNNNLGTLIISSKNYFTELQVEATYSIYLSKRIIYDESFMTSKVFYSATHYFILGKYFDDNMDIFLLAYERKNNQSYMLEKFQINKEETIFFLDLNYSLENDKNIFVYFSGEFVQFIQISSPKLYLYAKTVLNQDVHFNFNFSIYSRESDHGRENLNSTEFLFFMNDNFMVTIFDLNDSSLKICSCQNQTFSFNLNFPSFTFSFKDLVKGPSKKFVVWSEQSNFIGEIKNTQTSNQGALNLDNSSLHYLFFFTSDNDNFYKFVQYYNYSIFFSTCLKYDPNYCTPINMTTFQDLIDSVFIYLDTMVISWVHNKQNLDVFSIYEGFLHINQIIIPYSMQCNEIYYTQYSIKGLCVDNSSNLTDIWYKFNLFDNIDSVFVPIYQLQDFESYFKIDISLIDNNLILASDLNGINIFYFNQAGNSISLAGIFEYPIPVSPCFQESDCYFLIYIPNTENLYDMKLILLNYNQNTIVEYNANNVLSPQILRTIPLYNYKITPDLVKFVGSYLLVSALNLNSTLSILNFDLMEQTENILTKTLSLNNLSFYSLDTYSEVASSNSVEFILLNQTSLNFTLYQIYPFEFVGQLKLENISISGAIINNTLHFNTTSNLTTTLNISVNASNEFTNSRLDIPVSLNFQFQESYLNFSQNLYSELGNITNINFRANVKEIELEKFFTGPIINYQIQKAEDKNQPEFTLRTKIELETIIHLEGIGYNPWIIYDSLIHCGYLFILESQNLKIFDMNKNLKFVTSYPISDYYQCDSLYKVDEEPGIILQCSNIIARHSWIMILNYTNNTFPQDLTVFGNDSITTITALKSIGKWLFFVQEKSESLNESEIDVYQIQDNDLIFVNQMTAESFSFSYLFVDFFNIQALDRNNTDANSSFGIVFVNRFTIVYCELNIQSQIINISTVMTVEFLSILTSLNDYMILQIDNNLTKILNLHWRKNGSNDKVNLIISTKFHTIESSHQKSAFSEFNITLLYMSYLQCENYYTETFQDFQIIDNFLINICEFTNYDFDNTPNKYYVSLYNRYDNSSTNDSFNKTQIAQAIVYDVLYFSNFFIYKFDNGTIYLIVLNSDYSILQYRLNEKTYLVKNDNYVLTNKLSETYSLNLIALNDYSNISIRISVIYSINPLDVTKFVCFVILPLMISIVCICGTHFFINITRKKRKEMIMEQFSICKEQKNHEFECWLGNNNTTEQLQT